MSFSITAACIGCTACAKACPVSAIAGERKSQHSVDPSRCVECGACGRVCPVGAVRDADGAQVQKLPKAAWPKPVFDLGRCVSCGVCEVKCPTLCIVMAPTGFPGHAAPEKAVADDWKPRLEKPDACVSCGWCAFYCPMSCIVIAAPPPARTPARTREASTAEKPSRVEEPNA